MWIFSLFFLFLLITGCGSLKDNILLAVDGETEEFNVIDFTNTISKTLKEKYGKVPRLFILREENVYDKIFSSPSSFLKDFNATTESKYFYIVSIKPLTNQLKDRVEYEMLFASLESEDKNFLYSRKPVISPYRAIQWLKTFNEREITNLKKIYVFGRKSDKLLVFMNTNKLWKSIDKKNISKIIDLFFVPLSGSNIIYEMRETVDDVSKFFKTNELFEDEYFEDANNAMVFVVSPTAKLTNERNFFEALLFNAKSSFKKISQVDAPLKSSDFIYDLSAIFPNYAELVSDVVIYWKLNPDSLSRKFIEFKKYGDFINLEGNYLLATSIEKLMPKGYFELEDFFDKSQPAEENKIINSLQDAILEKRLFYLFYGQKGGVPKKLIFFEYVTTGKILVKLVFGPVENEKIDYYVNELKKLGIKLESKPVTPKIFR